MHYTEIQHAIPSIINEGFWEWNLVLDRLLFCDYCCELTGYTSNDTVFDTVFLKSVIYPDDQKEFFDTVRGCSRDTNEASTIVCRLAPREGSARWIEFKFKALEFDDNGKAAQIAGRLIDITDRKQMENQLYKLNRSFRTISKCNQTVFQTTNENELLNDICRIVVEIGGYELAWVGYAQNDSEKSVLPVAKSGIEDGFLELLKITWNDDMWGRGLTGTSIRTGQPSVVHDMQTDPRFEPWRSVAMARGYASGIGIPLKYGTTVFGALNIYSDRPDAFDTDETNLLCSLADSLAYGIRKLKSRDARKTAESALRQSEARHRTLFENKYIVMLIINPKDGGIIDANPAAVAFYGWAHEELCRMNIKQICILSKDCVQSKMQQNHNHSCVDFEFRHRLADGSIRDVEVVSVPIDIEGNALLYSIVHDITERKRSQEMLIEGNKRMHFIMSAAHAGLWENGIGPDAATIWSDEIWALYGLEPNSCVPTLENWLNTILPADRVRIEADVEKATANSADFNAMYRVRDPDGSIRWIMSKGTPFKDSDGQVLRYVGIVIDITERKKDEEAKHQLEAQLRIAQRLETIGTLAGGIAHDINNMLTPILGYSEMGMLSLHPEDSEYEYFSEIMHAADRAQNLIAQILTFSKSKEISSSVVSIQSVVAEALKLLWPSIPATISIEQSIDRTCRNILADPSQIHQIVVNLCTNAFQAMEETVGLIRIELKEVLVGSNLLKTLPKLSAGSYVRLSISDNGPGMDEAIMERIFEPFFTTKAMNKGTGLGLSVVHGIVTGLNGAITVDSHPGKGTSFYIYLPVIDEQIESSANDKPVLEGSSKILFIDDEESGTRMMSAMLTKLGFGIQTFNSPIEAIAYFRLNPEMFDLVITDLTMPEMNGTDLAAELFKTNPRIPIVLMTGYEKNLSDSRSLHEFGISKFLKKPVKMAHLASTINEVLSCAKA